MTSTTTTKASGGTSRRLPGVYVPPERQKSLEELAAITAGAGNGVFIADVLSDIVAHEQAGLRLFRSAAGRSSVGALRDGYAHLAEDTKHHLEAVTGLVRDLGGDPAYVSPAARAVEAMGTAILEASFLLDGSLDAVTRELQLLDAAAAVETKDQANWAWLAALADELPEGEARDRLTEATQQVTDEIERDHPWASPTRARTALLLATHPDLARAATHPDEAVERLDGLLR